LSGADLTMPRVVLIWGDPAELGVSAEKLAELKIVVYL